MFLDVISNMSGFFENLTTYEKYLVIFLYELSDPRPIRWPDMKDVFFLMVRPH